MLANIIKIIHLILVILIVSSPFIDSIYIKENVLVFLIYLLFQYVSGYQRCGLTQLEYYAMGEKYQEGFLYRLITPIISIPENYFDQWLIVIHIMYIFILILQLYNHFIIKNKTL